MPTIATVRPYTKTDLPTLTDESRFLTDSLATGVRSTRWADFRTQLDGRYAQLTQRNAANGYAGVAADGLLDPSIMRAALVPEEVASDAAKNALVVAAGDVGKRLVRVTATGINYLAAATGSGANKWVVYNTIPAATEATSGIAEIATDAEADAETDDARIMSPLKTSRQIKAKLNPIAATRAQSSYGQGDGITVGRGIVYPGSDRTLLTSVAAFEFVAEALFPATTVNENRGILTVGNTSVNATTGGFSFIVYGAHLFFNLGISGGQWQAVNYALTNAGLRKRFHVSIPCGTQSAPTVTDETGATVTFTQSVAPSGADAWLGSTLAVRAFVVGTSWPAGEIPRVVPILGTLSTAEKTEYRTTGRLPAWVMAGGSAVSLYSSDFSAGLNGWSTGSGTLDFNQDGVTDGTTSKDNCLRFYANASNVAHGAILSLPAAVAGRRIRVSGEYYIPAGQTAVNGIEFQTTGMSATPHLSAVGVWSTFSVESISGGSPLNFYLKAGGTGYIFAGANSATDDRVFVRNIVVTQLGAVTFPAYQGVGTVRDLTARGATDSNQGRLVGVTPILAVAQCGSAIKIPAQAFGAGTWVQILGGAVTGGNKQRIVSITGNSSANTTIDVGINGSTATIASAQTTNGDFDVATFLSRFLAANSSVWVRFAAATTAHVTINTSDL
jgi:hypothetical protein